MKSYLHNMLDSSDVFDFDVDGAGVLMVVVR